MDKYLIAAELKKASDEQGFLNVLNEFSTNIEVSVPMSDSMWSTSIDDLPLSPRSKNGLLRAGAKTVGDVSNIIMNEQGLAGVRNLGKKSVSEIKTVILLLAYDKLTDREKAQFWLYVAENNGGRDHAER